MIWKVNYINLYISARKNLNSENIEKIPESKINHIGKLYDKKYFDHYKKQVFLKWVFKNSKNSEQFLKRAKKLAKKLDIKLNDSEKEKLESIKPKEFTTRRALKTIEVPYRGLTDSTILLKPNSYFFYKGIRVYEKELTLLKQVFKGEIYMTSEELVFYERNNNKIYKIIKYNDISEIILKNYAVIILLKNKEKKYLRFNDNELIYISLTRVVVIRKKIDFFDYSREEGDTTEKTIEAFFDLDD